VGFFYRRGTTFHAIPFEGETLNNELELTVKRPLRDVPETDWTWRNEASALSYMIARSGLQEKTIAIECGIDAQNGRIVDQISEMGVVLSPTSRSWPHAEALKALTIVDLSPHLVCADTLTTAVLRRVLKLYCPDSLKGGWQDQLDAEDKAVRPNIPASTLYHLYFGIAAVEDAVNSSLDNWTLGGREERET